MYTRKIKKEIFIYCEGKSEKNYFEALKRNFIISNNYVLKINSEFNDLDNAIRRIERLEIEMKVIFIYDSDTCNKGQKLITEKIKLYKGQIYFSEEEFEDFLKCHKTKPYYHDRKPNLNRELLEEIRQLNKNYILNHIKKPNKYKDFKTIYDLLLELIENKL